ncbi:Putative deoxyribonuclease TATDN3 [Apodemus speciosus]|uniref:Deoxyribonuclease TATDN3 n=1 Tax=Apodemus speciosus TaxID=105296 RepID=A0ABQ0EFG9_APOSI
MDLDAALPIIEKYKDRLLAIGEVGLDFSPRYAGTDEEKEEQRQVLIRQVQLAKRLNVPLNVHSRSAGRPTISLLREQEVQRRSCCMRLTVGHRQPWRSKGRLLLLGSPVHRAKWTVRYSYFEVVMWPSKVDCEGVVAVQGAPVIKMGGRVPQDETHPRKQKLVKQLPLSSICLETDSPALGPEKLTRNEPCNLSIAAEFIAQVKGISVEEVREVTTQNAFRLFPKLQNLLQK